MPAFTGIFAALLPTEKASRGSSLRRIGRRYFECQTRLTDKTAPLIENSSGIVGFLAEWGQTDLPTPA